MQIHRDEESGKILNLVFVWAEDGMKLKVDVPVVFEGEDACPGVQKGNSLDLIFLEFDVQALDCVCLGLGVNEMKYAMHEKMFLCGSL